MKAAPDEDAWFHDELAERRRRRDHHREPGTRPRPTGNQRLERRLAFHARIAPVAPDSITAVECPRCLGPVFVPRDSDAERVDCFECDARLVTLQHIEGVTAIEADEPRGDQ